MPWQVVNTKPSSKSSRLGTGIAKGLSGYKQQDQMNWLKEMERRKLQEEIRKNNLNASVTLFDSLSRGLGKGDKKYLEFFKTQAGKWYLEQKETMSEEELEMTPFEYVAAKGDQALREESVDYMQTYMPETYSRLTQEMGQFRQALEDEFAEFQSRYAVGGDATGAVERPMSAEELKKVADRLRKSKSEWARRQKDELFGLLKDEKEWLKIDGYIAKLEQAYAAVSSRQVEADETPQLPVESATLPFVYQEEGDTSQSFMDRFFPKGQPGGGVPGVGNPFRVGTANAGVPSADEIIGEGPLEAPSKASSGAPAGNVRDIPIGKKAGEEKGGKVDPVILDLSKAEGVDPLLVQAIVNIESSGGKNNVGDVGSARGGSYGPMQVDALNLKAYGLTPDEVLRNPRLGIEAGIRKLKEIIEKYGVTDIMEILRWYNGWDPKQNKPGANARAERYAQTVMAEYKRLTGGS